MERSTILEVRELKKFFPIGKKYLHAVDGVSFTVERGTTLGIVGESGCGKTTLGRVILGLTPATSGEVIFEGQDITKYSPKQLRKLKNEMQIIFQDPYASVDPRKSVVEIIAEYMLIHHTYPTRREIFNRAAQLMDIVGLARRTANSYPHELDGGRRQRIGIARALSLNPQFIVCDEPVSALDVSIQAQVVNLLKRLQQQMGLSYLFITHDLSMVRHISHQVGVMYLGKMVELADSYELIAHSIHPYTRSLISAIPVADPITARQSKRIVLQGDVPSPLNPPSGCRFRTRCPYADEQCANEVPEFKEVSTGHWAACHHLDKVK